MARLPPALSSAGRWAPGKNMEKWQLERFKQRLLDEREELTGIVDFMEEDSLGISLKDSTGELSTCDNHPADIGSEVFERSKDFALREQSLIALAAVDQALQRIKDGAYGCCDICGKKIGLERLEAIPSTTRCIQCQEEEEKIPDPNIRPVEEEVLTLPFARTNIDADVTALDRPGMPPAGLMQ